MFLFIYHNDMDMSEYVEQDPDGENENEGGVEDENMFYENVTPQSFSKLLRNSYRKMFINSKSKYIKIIYILKQFTNLNGKLVF